MQSLCIWGEKPNSSKPPKTKPNQPSVTAADAISEDHF